MRKTEGVRGSFIYQHGTRKELATQHNSCVSLLRAVCPFLLIQRWPTLKTILICGVALRSTAVLTDSLDPPWLSYSIIIMIVIYLVGWLFLGDA